MTDRTRGTSAHREAAQATAARCAVVVVSDSRTEQTDESGPLARRLLEEAGHSVVHGVLLANDEARVRDEVSKLITRDDVDVVILSGGTGLGTRDRTVEAVRPLLEKELPGFGELFRWVSYKEQIGTAAILTRALAGTANKTLIVSLPGSKKAVDLALKEVLLPELKHLLHELTR
ncbi:MAG TPA: MogA/MoaB family molybdenum cofactor biosynthesis protein [Gemmatimonadaceae bacterium]|nr:MogA/MoaB family molybdenum cofactor biosynthesis protein [Gemmatimonadaceae bacterium]